MLSLTCGLSLIFLFLFFSKETWEIHYSEEEDGVTFGQLRQLFAV